MGDRLQHRLAEQRDDERREHRDAMLPPPPRNVSRVLVVDSRAVATDLLSLGFRIFPLAPWSKVPRITGGRGVLDATDDPGIAYPWADMFSGCNWGIGLDGLVVVDVDMSPGKSGRETMERLVAQHGRMPDTAVQRSCGTGLHYIYTDPGVPILRGENKLGLHVDIKSGAEHYVVAPGSYAKVPAKNGRPGYEGPYRWLARRAPAPLPSWIVDALRPPPPPPPSRALPPREGGCDVIVRARKWLAEVPGAVSGQNGHRQTFWAALGLVRGFMLDEDTAFSLLLSEYNPRCQPAWKERELRHKVRSTERSTRALGFLLNEPRRDGR
jgi:hypothetical protein